MLMLDHLKSVCSSMITTVSNEFIFSSFASYFSFFLWSQKFFHRMSTSSRLSLMNESLITLDSLRSIHDHDDRDHEDHDKS